MASIQVTWGLASEKDLDASEARLEKRVDALWEELSRRERLAFRQDDWERGRAEINKDIEFECRRPIERIERLVKDLHLGGSE